MEDQAEETPDETALQWFVRLRDGELDNAEREAFDDWLAASPDHAHAWAELETIWRDLDGVRPSEEPAVSGLPSRAIAKPRAWRPRLLGLAASLLVALGLAGFLMRPDWIADHRTVAGERRTIALADGSQVELAPASAIDVDLTATRRSIRLLSGQAFFTVARDPGRPFSVTARDGTVTALGTAFDVKLGLGSAVSVAVDESRVEVRVPGAAGVVVASGQGVGYDGRTISPPAALDPGEIGDWRRGRLVFHDVRLAEVVADLERYGGGRIQILSGDAAQRRVTAVLDARDPAAGLDMLAGGLGLRVVRPFSWLTLLLPV
ncbi:MAG TPA: FecR family protein [Bosea sp. (in: a-proteobacteria)]|uniref:FecR family protein n=1 Tax=Bosea sp. (in: a-proteobacteria) TaxID=1871050 RepID=UPI002E0D6997|nr:FecR family protein [Bosea sp. (in: a-proteobacteria)]